MIGGLGGDSGLDCQSIESRGTLDAQTGPVRALVTQVGSDLVSG